MAIEQNLKRLFWEQNKANQNSSMLSQWASNLRQFEQILIMPEEQFQAGLLGQPVIAQSMLMHSPGAIFDHELSEVKRILPSELLEKSLRDPANIGGAPLFSFPINGVEVRSSHNTVHHNYHIARYVNTIGLDSLLGTNSFVEWGGGYGNFARIVKALIPGATYTIIDLPIVLAVQWRYLSAVLGKESLNVVIEPSDTIQPGKINLVPSTRWQEHELKADMFVATWSLSESPIDIQKQVAGARWFDTTKRLLAFHQCGFHIPFMAESNHLKEELEKDEATKIEHIAIIPGINYYAFR